MTEHDRAAVAALVYLLVVVAFIVVCAYAGTAP